MPTDWSPLAIDILHSLHGPGFAAMALAIFWYLQSRCLSNINYGLAAAITMGIGLISELAQIPGPRDAQIKDLIVDALGILGALGVSAAFDKKFRSAIRAPARLLLPVAAGAALTIACLPTLWLTYASIQQRSAFPSLLTFEHAWEAATFGQTANQRPDVVDAPFHWPASGKKVSRSSEDGRWGIFLSLHPAQDWRGYSQLSFVAASNGERFAMDIGIREKHNRYYSSIWVEPGPQRFTITFDDIRAAAKDGPFDFSRVESVVFSAAKPGGAQELLLDDIRLEP
ncbi:MAG: hypothetical protein IH913_13910 [Proteobacteria bacterium]|nr:hypothetical protein [Pseudomonadota bacterium]